MFHCFLRQILQSAFLFVPPLSHLWCIKLHVSFHECLIGIFYFLRSSFGISRHLVAALSLLWTLSWFRYCLVRNIQ